MPNQESLPEQHKQHNNITEQLKKDLAKEGVLPANNLEYLLENLKNNGNKDYWKSVNDTEKLRRVVNSLIESETFLGDVGNQFQIKKNHWQIIKYFDKNSNSGGICNNQSSQSNIIEFSRTSLSNNSSESGVEVPTPSSKNKNISKITGDEDAPTKLVSLFECVLRNWLTRDEKAARSRKNSRKLFDLLKDDFIKKGEKIETKNEEIKKFLKKEKSEDGEKKLKAQFGSFVYRKYNEGAEWSANNKKFIIAKQELADGYWFEEIGLETEPLEKQRMIDQPAKGDDTREEEFRLALVTKLNSEAPQTKRYVLKIPHEGRESEFEWQFPDLLSIRWDESVINEAENEDEDLVLSLDAKSLTLRQSSGQAVFKIISSELKIYDAGKKWTKQTRMHFFQALSNSSWADECEFVIGIRKEKSSEATVDGKVLKELRRLGRVHNVTVKICEVEKTGDKVQVVEEKIVNQARLENTEIDWDYLKVLEANNNYVRAVFFVLRKILEHTGGEKQLCSFEDFPNLYRASFSNTPEDAEIFKILKGLLR